MQLDIFSPKAPPLFGLDISSSSVKMLEIVDAGKGGYRVERYVIEPLPRDATVDGNISNLEMVVEAVKRAYKRLGTRAKHVAMAVPTGAVITKKIVVPASLRETELELQVESEANQYIPFALEEVNLDFQVVGPSPTSPDEQEVMIAATRKEKVEDRVAVAESAGLKAAVMDIESFAQQTALGLVVNQLPGSGKDLNVAIVDVGANVMNVSVMRNDQSVYSREQAFGGSQLTQDIVARYGSFVQLRPPLRLDTALLWFGPVLVLVLGGIGAAVYVRGRSSTAAVGALDANEEAELARMLDGDKVG